MSGYYDNNRYNVKFVLDGDRSVGKTFLLMAYAAGRPRSDIAFNPSHRLVTEFLTSINGVNCVVYLYDLNETDQRNIDYRRFDGVFLTFALDDRSSFDTLTARREELLSHVEEEFRYLFPCVVLANKRDVTECEIAVTDEEIHGWCGHSVPHFKTSFHHADVPVMKLAVDAMLERVVAYEAARDRYGTKNPRIRLSDGHAPGGHRSNCCC